MILALRSTIFNLLFFGGTVVLCLALWPALLLRGPHLAALGRLWARYALWVLRLAIGLRHEVRGGENRIPGAAIYAAKHQSAWETIAFFLLLDGPVFVLKAELLFIPIIGWYLRRAGMIAVKRSGGASTLRAMLAGAELSAQEGRPIVIFPEGTRTAPGASRPYHPGIAALYARLGLKVVPVALNSGLFWPRRGFRKQPGTIVIEFLEPIAPGLEREAFSSTLRARIEGACARLSAGGRA